MINKLISSIFEQSPFYGPITLASNKSARILSYFIQTSGESLKVALGLRGNSSQLKFYQQSTQDQAFRCATTAIEQIKKVSRNVPQRPDSREIIERGGVVIKGIQEAIKLAGKNVTSFKPSQLYKDHQEEPVSTNAPTNGPKLQSMKLPKDKILNIKLPERQELSDKARERKVPATRIARLASFGCKKSFNIYFENINFYFT